jgi:hypothetical protein
MSFIGDAIGSVVGGITGTNQAARGAQRAADIQFQASTAGIDEQRRQFDQLVQVLSPYVQAGVPAIGRLSPYEQAGAGQLGNLGQIAGAGMNALQMQQALAGMLGPEAQQQAISMVEQSPEMAAMVQQGENALLQQASATGGLRGGNVQAALAQFRPQVLSQLINQQYSRLGGLTDLGSNVAQNLVSGGQTATQNIAQLGQASAAQQGVSGLQSAQQVSNLLTQGGQAQAGGALAAGQRTQQAMGSLFSGLGAFSGMGGVSGIKGLF